MAMMDQLAMNVVDIMGVLFDDHATRSVEEGI